MVEDTQNQQPLKRIKGEEEEDRISLLPDCLITEILSRLPDTKQAIKTGVLSKRWQHLWTFVHTLILREHDIDLSTHRRYSLPNFLSFFNITISQCQSKKLNKFELQTRFHVSYELQLNNLIHYAINCNVQELYLESLKAKFELKDDIFFNNSCFTHLQLGSCIFSPSGVISWNKLTSFSLSYMKLYESSIQNILSGSPLLETLKLEYCCGYRRLDITSKSLKNLVFSGYYRWFPPHEPPTDIIEINAPNILSLTISGAFGLSKLLLLNVSSLLKAYLNYINLMRHTFIDDHDYCEEEMLQEVLLNLHHVKELKVGISCLKVLSRLEAKGVKLPSNVKCAS